jgi:hypothetical protein
MVDTLTKGKELFLFDHYVAGEIIRGMERKSYNKDYYENLVSKRDRRLYSTEKRWEKGISVLQAHNPKDAVTSVFTYLFQIEKERGSVRNAQDFEGRTIMDGNRPVRLLEVYQDIILKDQSLCLVVSSYPDWEKFTDPLTIYLDLDTIRRKQVALPI